MFFLKYKKLLVVCIVVWTCLIFYHGNGRLYKFKSVYKNVSQNDIFKSIYKKVVQKDILDNKMVTPATFGKVGNVVQLLIDQNYTGSPCNYTLDLPHEQILQKISSYQFPGVQNYIEELFPHRENEVLPEYPVFVTGFSSNHFKEGLAMLYNFNRTINENNTLEIIVYDIGLNDQEINQVKREFGVPVRKFPFDKFPDHIGILKAYAWKPLIIQLVSRDHPFVVWIDASIRFKTHNIEDMLQRAKKYGVMAADGWFPISYQTSIQTFRFLNEPPCLYKSILEPQAGFNIVYQTQFIKKYFMIPWVSCALARGCMVPNMDVNKIIDCGGQRHYFHCHRFDQSILGILLNRLFPKTMTNHTLVVNKYFSICGGCTKYQ